MNLAFVADGRERLLKATGEQEVEESFTWRGWWRSWFNCDYRLF